MAEGGNKGPAGAVIRQVSEAEADAAFNDEAGGVPRGEVGMARQPGGRGSIAGIRTGSKEAGGGIDTRAAENIQRRAAAKAAARAAMAGNSGAQQPPAKPAVQTPSQARKTGRTAPDGLEDWERQATVAAPAIPPAAPLAPGGSFAAPSMPAGDLLEQAQRQALSVLAAIPAGLELWVSGEGLGPEGVSLVMGLGFAVAKGYAAYRGDGHWRATPEGRAAARSYGSDE